MEEIENLKAIIGAAESKADNNKISYRDIVKGTNKQGVVIKPKTAQESERRERKYKWQLSQQK